MSLYINLCTSLSPTQRVLKRTFDVIVSVVGLLLAWWIILIGYIIATLDTRQNGLFLQKRVGRHGKLFTAIKLRTMRAGPPNATTITASTDPRITRFGSFLRRTKIDELPQLINILRGHMSFVGPRPDVPGYADRLQGEDRIILSVRPGITGPATLKYRHEEELLAASDDPVRYNDEVIFPDKVRINREYVKNYSFLKDIEYILQTLTGK